MLPVERRVADFSAADSLSCDISHGRASLSQTKCVDSLKPPADGE
jgi:hypothetical protein